MKLKKTVDRKQKGPNRAEFFTPELKLPVSSIRSDLTRGILVTILALFLEISIYVYLQNGGWQRVLPILSKINL